MGALPSLAGLAWLIFGAMAVLAADATAEGIAVSVVGMLIGLAFVIFGMGCLKGGRVWTMGIVMSIVGTVAVYWWSAGTLSPPPCSTSSWVRSSSST